MSDIEVNKVGEKLAPFNPTCDEAIELAFKTANLQSNDVVYDLGCGDGRVLIYAAKTIGCRCIGYEYDKVFYDRAIQNIKNENLEERITVYHQSSLEANITDATLIFLYLVPEGLKKIKSIIEALYEKGVRIVTYIFSLPYITPIKVEHCRGVKIYYYKKEIVN